MKFQFVEDEIITSTKQKEEKISKEPKKKQKTLDIAEKKEIEKSIFVGTEKTQLEDISLEDIRRNMGLEKFFEDLAKSSEFRRLIYKTLTGKVHRGNTETLNNELLIKLKEFRMNNL